MVKKVKGYCPKCDAERELRHMRTREKVAVRGEKIGVDAFYWRCLTCGEEFEGPDGTHDEVAEAYRLYRAKKGHMQPEDIKALREDYGLTQSELAQVLGFGAVTLSRYENGMLQTAAHDRMLQMVRDPRAFWSILNRLGEKIHLPPERLRRLREKLRETVSSSQVLDPILEASLSYEGDDRSGNRRFHLEKFINVILFFCQSSQWKTTINKFLFYADFKCFRDHGHSITGARYAHATYGPCPDMFEHLFIWLADRGNVEIAEVSGKDYGGEKIRALTELDLSVFSTDESRVLVEVRKILGRKTAKTLSDLSHGERGYKETETGQLISYKYAEFLRI
ncbi:MAG: type II TA system antitoxin MqsA family protein [Candidatus Binatia bacterium]